MNDPWLLLALGSGLFALGIWELSHSRHLLRRGVRTRGTVTGIREEMSGEEKMYYPIIHFIDRDGAEQTVRFPSGSNWKEHRIGQQVPVLYLPDEPESAKIEGTFDLWGVPFVSFTMGSILVGLSLWEFLK